MAYLYPRAFRNFDPISGTVPDLFRTQFTYVAERARAILAQRTVEQILFAYRSLLWIAQKREDEDREALFSAGTGATIEYWTSPAKDVLHVMDRVEISGQADFPDATWQEYFAVLALSCIGHCKEMIPVPRVLSKGDSPEMESLRVAADIAFDATEAIAIAEMLIREAHVIPTATEKTISLRNSIAAIAKHQLTANLKASVIEEFPSISNREAGRRIFSRLRTQAEEALRGDEAEKTHRFAIWIGQYRRLGD